MGNLNNFNLKQNIQKWDLANHTKKSFHYPSRKAATTFVPLETNHYLKNVWKH